MIKIFRKAHIAEPHEQEVFTRVNDTLVVYVTTLSHLDVSQRLIRESNVWRQLDHPNVQVGLHTDQNYFVLNDR